MKVKNIIINIIPLLIWVIYSKLTSMPEKTYFFMPVEDLILSLCIPLFYGIYNSFSKKIGNMLIADAICILSHSIGCFISGKIYLSSGFRGSDYLFAVNSITVEVIIASLVIIAICIITRLVIHKLRNKKFGI